VAKKGNVGFPWTIIEKYVYVTYLVMIEEANVGIAAKKLLVKFNFP